MSVDDILAVIDGGLQSSSELGLEPLYNGFCWRCTSAKATTNLGLCERCREALKSDDTTEYAGVREFTVTFDLDVSAFEQLSERLGLIWEPWQRHIQAMTEVFRQIQETLHADFAAIIERELANAPKPSAPAARNRVKARRPLLCPRHGQQPTIGYCRCCQRETRR